MTTVILDYGLGNVGAFEELYKRNDIPVRRASSPEQLEGAERLILPGVGAFDFAIKMFSESGLRSPVDYLVREQGIPVLGVCVGMQMMANGSDEGSLQGLGWIDAQVQRFDAIVGNKKLPTPHMGWNDVSPVAGDILFEGLEKEARFYFLHSYYVQPKAVESTIATSVYGQAFCCAFRNGNVYGVQFHPEKGHHWGARLLSNFARIYRC